MGAVLPSLKCAAPLLVGGEGPDECPGHQALFVFGSSGRTKVRSSQNGGPGSRIIATSRRYTFSVLVRLGRCKSRALGVVQYR